MQHLFRTLGFLKCCVAVASCDNLLATALDSLKSNFDNGLGGTLPAARYQVDPHLSSTESLLAAWALAHSHPNWAQQEINSQLKGQWDNGMLPKIRFQSGYDEDWLKGTIYPGPSTWNQRHQDGEHQGESFNTTSLAALPLHAEVVLQVYDLSPRSVEDREWLTQVVPKLYAYHAYLHSPQRSLPGSSLVYLGNTRMKGKRPYHSAYLD
ncbi:unnamed protein product [Chrysoparadoxa australica]